MTTRTRRQLGLLTGLIVVGVALVYWRTPAPEVSSGARTTPGAQASRPGETVGDVRLERLADRADARGTPDRNLFRFEARRAAQRAVSTSRGRLAPAPTSTEPPSPPQPPPPPPIPLRYIGFMDQPGAVPRVGVLSDGRGNVFSGREGDIIEGRYRVLRIGTDSADLIYVDGRGRQTIRLSGQ